MRFHTRLPCFNLYSPFLSRQTQSSSATTDCGSTLLSSASSLSEPSLSDSDSELSDAVLSAPLCGFVLRVLLEDGPVSFVPCVTGTAPPRPAASLPQPTPFQKSSSRDMMIFFALMSHSRYAFASACTPRNTHPRAHVERSSYDWITNSSAVWYATTNQTTLAFNWTSALQVNPMTVLAAPASTCYCTVLPSNSSTGFSITVDSVALPSPSTASRLSDGALAAAVVVPTLVALALLAEVVWRYGRKYTLRMEDIEARKDERPPPLSRRDYGVSGANAISMIDLRAKGGRAGEPMLKQQWYSDSS